MHATLPFGAAVVMIPNECFNSPAAGHSPRAILPVGIYLQGDDVDAVIAPPAADKS